MRRVGTMDSQGRRKQERVAWDFAVSSSKVTPPKLELGRGAHEWEQLTDFPDATVVEDLLHPERDDSHYAFERNSDHRNIYGILIPN